MKERLKKDKKFRRNMILFAILIVVLVAASVYTVFIKPNLNTETYVYIEEEVTRGDLILGIMESGSVSLGESSVMYELDLDLDDDDDDDSDSDDDDEEEETKYLEIEEVYVVSGQRISEGDPLFQFTQDSVDSVRRKLSSALTEAQITLSEAQTEYNISLLSAQSTYNSSVTSGNRADADYQAALTESAESVSSLEAKIKVLELEIQQAQEALTDEDFLDSYDDAKTAYTQAKNKYEETDLHNSTAYTSNLTSYQEAKSQLEQIEDEIEGYQDTITDNQKEIEELQTEIEEAKAAKVLSDQEAENNYNSAKTEGELAEDIYNYTIASLEDTVTLAQADVDELQETMDDFEALVGSDNTIYAAEAGLVTGVSYEAGDDLITAGAMLTYTTEDSYTVSIDVSEEDVAAIKVGDQVDLAFAAYPDNTWVGTITSITTSATSDYASTISYPVTILVEGDTSLLYGGMTADVTFVTDSVTDVLYVSKKAVFEQDGKSYVYKKMENGSMEAVEVETGFSDISSIEIISGLEEGDTIYLESIMNVDESETDFTKDTTGASEDTGGTDAGSGDSSFDFGGEMPDMGDIPDMGDMPDMGNGSFPGQMGGN